MVLPALLPHASKPLRHTRKALVTLKQAGDVRGWFGLVQKGRPSKKNPNPIDRPDDGAAVAAAGAVAAPGTAAKDLPPPLCPRDWHHPGRTNWAIPAAFE